MRKKIDIDLTISDPFKHLAYGLTGSDKEDLWEETPVDIQEFIEDKKFLNLKWDGERGCRPKIMEIAKEVVKENIREAILLLGKGSGKGFISTILHLYGIYRCLCMYSPQKYFGLSPGSPMYFVNTARNDKQAKKVFFAEFKGHLRNCPWFAGKYSEPGIESVRFIKNIEALSANSQAFSWLGFNIIQWVGDELAFFLTNDQDDDSESRAEECWEAAFGSCQTRFPKDYKMIGITTPRYDDDFVMKKWHECNEREDAYAVQLPTWEVNPLLTKADFKYALGRNYRRTMRDFGATPQGVIESFWSDPDYLEENVCQSCRGCPIYKNRSVNSDIYACYDYEDCKANMYLGNGQFRDWSHPKPDREYFMHFDLSYNKDRTSFSMSHIESYIDIKLDGFELQEIKKKDGEITDSNDFMEKAIIEVDLVGFISPSSQRDGNLIKNGEIYYDGIYKHIIVGLRNKGFHFGKITFDQFQSLTMRQRLTDDGIEVDLLSLDRNDEVPITAKVAITENRVFYPYNRVLCDEARHLKYIKGKKVDHIRKKTKDVIDGFFGSIYNSEKSYEGSGTFEALG